MESEKKFCDNYHGIFEVKTTKLEIAFEAEEEEGKEQMVANLASKLSFFPRARGSIILTGADGRLLMWLAIKNRI